MIDMLGRKKNRTVKKALKPYHVEVEPAHCPKCGAAKPSFYRTNDGLVCRDCREQVRTFGLPG